ncbi:MAG: GntR family transcriptional regulator [Bacillota bacterium]
MTKEERTGLHEVLPRLKPEALASEVYKHLSEAILSGVLAPGTRLKEADLARQLGVSATPVREALRRLGDDGLVEYQYRKGCWVRALSAREVREVYVVREAVEGMAARLAAVNRSEDGLAQLLKLQEKGRAALGANDLDEYHRYNAAFHEAIVEQSGCRLLEETLTPIRHQIRLLTLHTVRYPGRPNVAVEEHEQILGAIERRDADEAERLMRFHIRRAMEEMLSRMAASSGKEEQ